jgi:hypothetical protein
MIAVSNPLTQTKTNKKKYKLNILPLPNPPLIKGRELDFYCFPSL